MEAIQENNLSPKKADDYYNPNNDFEFLPPDINNENAMLEFVSVGVDRQFAPFLYNKIDFLSEEVLEILIRRTGNYFMLGVIAEANVSERILIMIADRLGIEGDIYTHVNFNMLLENPNSGTILLSRIIYRRAEALIQSENKDK